MFLTPFLHNINDNSKANRVLYFYFLIKIRIITNQKLPFSRTQYHAIINIILKLIKPNSYFCRHKGPFLTIKFEIGSATTIKIVKLTTNKRRKHLQAKLPSLPPTLERWVATICTVHQAVLIFIRIVVSDKSITSSPGHARESVIEEVSVFKISELFTERERWTN